MTISNDDEELQQDDRISGSYYVSLNREAEVVMTWQQVCDIIANGDLDHLQRHQRCDQAYRTWSSTIRKQYDGLENYVCQVRLGWSPPESKTDMFTIVSPLDKSSRYNSDESDPFPSVRNDKTKETWPENVILHPKDNQTSLCHFVHDLAEFDNGQLVKVILNDWPYGVPCDTTHWVVWSKLSILHPSLFETSDTPLDIVSLRQKLFERVTIDGVRGFTGFDGTDNLETYPLKDQTNMPKITGTFMLSQQDSVPLTFQLVSKAHWWAGRHIRTFIQNKWDPTVYQTAWFCNPPYLRTVPGLCHFHIFVRRKRKP